MLFHCLNHNSQVEAALGSSNYVDNIMVHADPMNSYCVALVVPSHGALEKWAEEAGVKHSDFAELCENGEAVKEVQQSLTKVCISIAASGFSYLYLVIYVIQTLIISGRKSGKARKV